MLHNHTYPDSAGGQSLHSKTHPHTYTLSQPPSRGKLLPPSSPPHVCFPFVSEQHIVKLWSVLCHKGFQLCRAGILHLSLCGWIIFLYVNMPQFT